MDSDHLSFNQSRKTDKIDSSYENARSDLC